MKWIVLFLPLFFLFVTCASVQDKGSIPLKTGEIAQRSEDDAQTAQTDMARTTTLVENVMLLSKESSYFSEGHLDSYTCFFYEDGGVRLIREELFTAGDMLFEKTLYEYEGNLLISKKDYDSEGALKYSRVFSYDGELLLKSTLIDRTGKVQNSSRYEYDDKGNKVRWNVYNGSDVMLAYTTYEYTDGKNVKINIYSPSDTLEGYSILDYNQMDEKVKESFFLNNGTLEKYTIFSYKEGLPVSERYFGADDRCVREVQYEYDEMGTLIGLKHLDSQGRVKEIKEMEYDVHTLTRTVPID
jgi:YD repeat-containing protein